MVDTATVVTHMYLIMEDNNRATHSVLDREDFVSNQSIFDMHLTNCRIVNAYRHVSTDVIVHFDQILHDWSIKYCKPIHFRTESI